MKGHIADMLRAQKRHLSFHTPGHKRAGEDITELSYSDCLVSPKGVIAEAERDIAQILGAEKSFILTDGSTSGVFAMLYALREFGGKTLAAPRFSHPCVAHACDAMGIGPRLIGQEVRCGIPVQPDISALEETLKGADALLLTSPDYYGNFPDLEGAKELCGAAGKPLLIDGAHGSHLHGTPMHASHYAAMWVDGVHKSLPALTQGAVVSAKDAFWAEKLHRGVLCFRTTSPSYPIMASVESAVKYPRNEALEIAAERFKRGHGCVKNADWSKILLPFGKKCDEVQRFLEAHGVYPEFNDGNYLMFYLSPCNRAADLKKLARLLKKTGVEGVEEGAPAGVIPLYTERS